jgi:phosphoribosylamine-glycine ligase
MGAYSPAPVMTEQMCQRTMDEIIIPTMKAMQAEGCPYQGVFFAGLMITAKGPQLIEYNVRFGDPECQVLMMRLKDDIVTLMLAVRWDAGQGVGALARRDRAHRRHGGARLSGRRGERLGNPQSR